ncbi:MAG: pseudouridine-5'-phosphate glycosidase [Candidatus Lustribacter sp.]|jgi:pseudouridine-5'-phosphate glycosidase
MSGPLELAPRVARALAHGGAVVALETTIVTHGMPFPQNVETALEVEALVRAGGAEPATIAVVDGRIRVGLEPEAIRALAGMADVRKVSRADLPFTVATGAAGATTVAATMIAAALAGIGVFATGGIGGVHRGAETTLDVSADLDELARTSVAVVCAGAKALLDLPKTLEVLETRGVPVICYRSDLFPAFWSRSSGLRAPLRLDSAVAIAGAIRAQRALGYASGTLIANPVDAADEIPAGEIAAHIEAAVAAARATGITGKDVTPFLLDRLLDLTGGRSLATNIALIKSNARLAADIAVALTA